MSATPVPVRYHEGIEQPRPDEVETIAAIIRTMTGEAETVAEGLDHHRVRPSHAKSTGVLKGTLEVLPGLPPALAQGLFAEPRRYEALVRLAQGPGEFLSDKVSTHRGMAIKVLGVTGPKLPGHDADTQDFVLATGKVFPQANSWTFLQNIRPIAASAAVPEGVKGAVSAAARAMNAAYKAVAGDDSPTLAFFGHTPRHPLADAYHSQVPMRWGDHVAKIGAFPASPEVLALGQDALDLGDDPDGFRTAVVAFFRRSGATFEIRAQLLTDPETMPVEDAATEWPEDESPYVTVARLTLPQQDAHSEARAAYFTDVLAFRPAHALAAHRPLGSLMRARLHVYGALQAHRARTNGVAQREPRDASEVPD